MAEDLPHHSTCEFMAPFPGTRRYLLFAHRHRFLTRSPRYHSLCESIVIGSPFSQRYSYCYSSRLPSSFAPSSCAGASGGASKRLFSPASLRHIIWAARVAVVLSARNQSCGRPGCPPHTTMGGTLLSYVTSHPSFRPIPSTSSPHLTHHAPSPLPSPLLGGNFRIYF